MYDIFTSGFSAARATSFSDIETNLMTLSVRLWPFSFVVSTRFTKKSRVLPKQYTRVKVKKMNDKKLIEASIANTVAIPDQPMWEGSGFAIGIDPFMRSTRVLQRPNDTVPAVA